MARESYNDLIFQLGDLAREHLAEKHPVPKAMDGVFECEEVLLGIRDEFAALEGEMNEEDAAYQDFLDQQAAEREELQAITRKWRHAVAGVETRSRDLRKSLSSQRAAYRYQKNSLKLAEEKHKELEQRELFADLLMRMLAYDPTVRVTAAEALQHPFFAGENGAAPSPCQARDWEKMFLAKTWPITRSSGRCYCTVASINSTFCIPVEHQPIG
jgi:serine/threonine protein kinase